MTSDTGLDISEPVDIYNTNRRYKTIYVDPPWPERGGGKIKRGADRHYRLMSIKEIEQLPVQNLAAPNGCHIYLWTTNNYLPEAIKLLDTWGFEYVTTITWMKDRFGLGQYYRGITEHCLFGTTKKKTSVQNARREAGARHDRIY